VDACVYHLQGEAEHLTPVELLARFQDFHRDKLAAMLRHRAGARHIGQYDLNNTYQFIINREETELSWLARAIEDLGGTVTSADEASDRAVARDADSVRSVLQEDADEAEAFVERWRPLVESVTNARQRGLLRVILGETLEQRRFFEQALAGRTDLLGRRGAQLEPSRGDVLPTRWLE
jgi:hypothetical protein